MTHKPGPSYNLALLHPDIAKEWNFSRNHSLSPEKVSPESNKIVWWECEKGHQWGAKISARVHGQGCPVCKRLPIEVEKEKPSKGLSYAFKTSLIEKFITGASLKHHIYLRYEGHYSPRSEGTLIFRAGYGFPTINDPNPYASIYTYAVPATERKQVAELMESSVLPAFISWMKRLSELPENSPVYNKHLYFEAGYSHGEVQIKSDF